MTLDYRLERIDTAALTLEYFLVPWDTEIFGFAVGQIERIKIHDASTAVQDFTHFLEWIEANRIRLANCRLEHGCLSESMFLESQGFRFIEMVYPLYFDTVADLLPDANDIEFTHAELRDLNEIRVIAQEAFATGRFNVDPRIGPELGGQRYSEWVRNSFEHTTQRVYKAMAQSSIVAFFIIESLPEDRVYWHLTAVSSMHQGRGIGKRAWQAMMLLNRQQGARRIETTISARNTPVINLYVDLRFRFRPPLMTFHWCRS